MNDDDSYVDALAYVAKESDLALKMDATGWDVEAAHASQDASARRALEWIAANSACSLSRELATLAVRPFHSDGERWCS